MTIRLHRDAVIAFLEARLPGAVFKSYSATAVPRYAVVFIARTHRDRSRYTGRQARDTYTVTVHSVADNEDSALWVQERVDQLTDVVLAVAGRSCWPAEYVTGVPPALDDDGPFPLWFAVTQFDIISDPA